MRKTLSRLLPVLIALTVLSACTVVETRSTPPRQTPAPDFYARIDDQQRRIDQGIASGKLTRREADLVQDNLGWIKREYARIHGDGKLTPREVQRLDNLLDQNNAMIFNKKNNPVKRLY